VVVKRLLEINLSCDIIENYLEFRGCVRLSSLDNEKSRAVSTVISEIKASHIFCCTVLLSDNYFSICNVPQNTRLTSSISQVPPNTNFSEEWLIGIVLKFFFDTIRIQIQNLKYNRS